MQDNKNTRDSCKLCSLAWWPKMVCVWRTARGWKDGIQVCWVLMHGAIFISEENKDTCWVFHSEVWDSMQVVQTLRSIHGTLGRRTLSSLPFDRFTCCTTYPYLCSIQHLCKADGFTLCLPMSGPFSDDQWGPASRCCGQRSVHLLGLGAQSSLLLKQFPGSFQPGGWTYRMPRRPDGRQIWKIGMCFPRSGVRRYRNYGGPRTAPSFPLFCEIWTPLAAAVWHESNSEKLDVEKHQCSNSPTCDSSLWLAGVVKVSLW